jgi:ABC-2 type transport system ATP-binding protein
MDRPSIISVSDLRFAYGNIVAIDGVTLEIPPGRIGLVGANGAGKTTLLKILLGVLPAGSGQVAVLGHDVATRQLDVRALVGWMPEGNCMPPDQTAADFLGYAAELGGLPVRAARQRASDVLGLVGLHEERFRFIGEFSTGMKQRAKLAQAIVHDPKLVLLDEPTAGLEPGGDARSRHPSGGLRNQCGHLVACVDRHRADLRVGHHARRRQGAAIRAADRSVDHR